MSYYIVKYQAHFGFIKPWTAVRDSETFSQQFLTPSIVEGIEKKLFPQTLNQKGLSIIQRHRLNYLGLDLQQERTWSKGGFKVNKRGKGYRTNLAIIQRGVMIQPHLYLAFYSREHAIVASEQHICLCRNEDVALPSPDILEMTKDQFDQIEGFELDFNADNEKCFLVGYNRYHNAQPMYGCLRVIGNPLRRPEVL